MLKICNKKREFSQVTVFREDNLRCTYSTSQILKCGRVKRGSTPRLADRRDVSRTQPALCTLILTTPTKTLRSLSDKRPVT